MTCQNKDIRKMLMECISQQAGIRRPEMKDWHLSIHLSFTMRKPSFFYLLDTNGLQ